MTSPFGAAWDTVSSSRQAHPDVVGWAGAERTGLDSSPRMGQFAARRVAKRNDMSASQPGLNVGPEAVSAVVWPWRRAASAADAGAATRALRRRAVIQALVTAAIGAAIFFLLKHKVAGRIVWGIAAFVLLSGLFAPSVFHAVDRFMKRFGQAVGTGLTYLLLAPFFYLIFMPGHFIMKVLRKDPLKLKFPSEEASFWSTRPPLKPDHFKKQF